ncbi:MAG: hypothetical protein KAI64_06145, partial [Thermoplasmata archaeon]|nr:hypothetical protein [Thermoplasmata archaeon]
EVFNIIVDTTPPSLPEAKLKPEDGYSTAQSQVLLRGKSDPGSTVIVRGVNLTADANGDFSIPLDLEAGINDISITAIDWFALDIAGNIIQGNSIASSRRIINDVVAPRIFSISNSTGTPTNKEFAVVKGFVEDFIGNLTSQIPWDPAKVELSVNGIETTVYSNGFFSIPVPLVEGVNTIALVAEDEAENTFTTYIVITKDVTAPALTLDAIPSETTSDIIQVGGVAEIGSTIFINGQYVTSEDGSFSFNVTLHEGLNMIVIEVIDEAGNTVKKTVDVSYAPPSQAFQYMIPLLILVFVLIFLIGLQVGSKRLSRKGKKAEETGEVKESDEVK